MSSLVKSHSERAAHSLQDLISAEMSMSLMRSSHLSTSLEKIEESVVKKQGIVSILGSDESETTKSTSLRRTLSADMSSKTWLAQNPITMIAPLQEYPIISIDDDDDNDDDSEHGNKGQLEIWNLIQEQEAKKRIENHVQFDIWTSIQSQNEDKLGGSPSKDMTLDSSGAPYIHPLVKRSLSSLSEKSLEICTESLGSETGSDGFSSYPSSENFDDGDQEEAKQQELRIAKHNKKMVPKSFPPPLPSLIHGEGPSLSMQSHRKNGRLVLEAVSVPSQNYFSAQRQDGRLLLSFTNSLESTIEDQPKEYEEIGEEVVHMSTDELEEYEEEEDENEAELDMESMVDQLAMPKQESTEMLQKLMKLANQNPSPYFERINQVVKFGKEEDGIKETPLSKSFPVPLRTVAVQPRLPQTASSLAAFAATFNVYETCWRKREPSPTTISIEALQKPPPFENDSITTTHKRNEQQQMYVLGGDINGCRESRRSLLFWEPHCIATS